MDIKLGDVFKYTKKSCYYPSYPFVVSRIYEDFYDIFFISTTPNHYEIKSKYSMEYSLKTKDIIRIDNELELFLIKENLNEKAIKRLNLK